LVLILRRELWLPELWLPLLLELCLQAGRRKAQADMWVKASVAR
jgi:hypothetical protein